MGASNTYHRDANVTLIYEDGTEEAIFRLTASKTGSLTWDKGGVYFPRMLKRSEAINERDYHTFAPYTVEADYEATGNKVKVFVWKDMINFFPYH